LAEHGAYGLLLDEYYSTERPLPGNVLSLYKLCRATNQTEKDAIKSVVKSFFKLGNDGLFHNKRADSEIAVTQRRSDIARLNGRNGGRPKKL
jgi:uncharacterized protein YdaU (DUF1376 family)